MKICSVPECERPEVTNGMCNAHYLRVRKHGDARAHIPVKSQGSGAVNLCSTGCGRVVLARGLCATHYQRWRTDGDAGETALRRVPGSRERTEKACTKCGEIKPVTEFYAEKRTRDGRQSTCKKCYGAQQSAYAVNRKYGLSPKKHAAMREAQGGKCPICQRKVKLVVDHCHRSGKVRALLCDRCNRMLGTADDDQQLLESAIAFLKLH